MLDIDIFQCFPVFYMLTTRVSPAVAEVASDMVKYNKPPNVYPPSLLN